MKGRGSETSTKHEHPGSSAWCDASEERKGRERNMHAMKLIEKSWLH